NIRLIICTTGAEEWGDYGAYYFIKENPCVLSPENTRFFIVDGIGTAEKTLILYGIGLPVRHWSLFLEKHARELIEESGVPFMMRTIPPLLQVASDHVPVENAGFEFIWFASNSFIFHSSKDNIKALNEENFREVCEFLDKFVRKIDKSL
ncbi:MAG: M28 family peptidase, partial [Promethearchaeota archaeon]